MPLCKKSWHLRLQGSWTCPSCGSHTWVLDYESDATCTRNGYREYSCDCGQSKRETIYATGHSYSYGSWEQYSTSQHRREAYCRNCGDSDYEYASHSMSYGSWSNSSSSQHSRTVSCRTCGYSTTDYGSHSYSTGSWSKYSDTQHRRSKTCSGCGASTYDYADHSYSYGSWTKADDVQHRRAKPAPFAAIARRSMAITRIPTQMVFAMIVAQMSR